MASCAHGPSEEAKKKVAAFDSSWNAMGAMAKACEDSIHAALANCENCCKAGEAMECCEHTKMAKDSLMSPCKNDMTAFQEMEKGWDAEKPKWDSLQTKLEAIKAQVAKGEGTDEEINKGLSELQAAMDEGNKGLQEVMAKLTEMKAMCMKNAETCKAGWSAVSCSDKKCAAHKKEEKKS